MKRRDFVLSATSMSAVALTPSAAAAARESAGLQSSTPWPVRGSEAFEFESAAVGDTMAVGVWRPDPQILAAGGRDANEPLDIVYVLDGSWALGVAATICTLQLVDLIKPGFPPLMLVPSTIQKGTRMPVPVITR